MQKGVFYVVIWSRTWPLKKGVQSTQARAPLGVRALVKCNVDWFWLTRVLCWFWYLDLFRKLLIDLVIEIAKWLTLISKKIGHRLLIAAFMKVLPHGAGNFSRDPSLGKIPNFFRIFRLYQILVEAGPELMLVPGPDCFLNGLGHEYLLLYTFCYSILQIWVLVCLEIFSQSQDC